METERDRKIAKIHAGYGSLVCFSCGKSECYTWTRSGHVCKQCYSDHVNLKITGTMADYWKVEP